MLVVIFMKGPYLMIVGGTELSAVGVSGYSAGGLISVVVTHLVEGLDFQVFRFSPHLFRPICLEILPTIDICGVWLVRQENMYRKRNQE